MKFTRLTLDHTCTHCIYAQGAVCLQLWPQFSDMESESGDARLLAETSYRQPRPAQEDTPSLRPRQRGLALYSSIAHLCIYTSSVCVCVCVCVQVQTVVSKAARCCTASAHTESLARAKEKAEGPFREPQWQVSDAAMRARPRDHVLDLARPKKVAEGYQPCREVEWRVGNGAKNAMASNR